MINSTESRSEKLPVYKKLHKVDKFIQVGQVDEYNHLEFDVPTYESIGFKSTLGDNNNKMPQIFYPKFYTEFETNKTLIKDVIKGDDRLREWFKTKHIPAGTHVSFTEKKVFIPKNLPNQLVSLKGCRFLELKDYYVTGYVDKDGIAIYYDQYLESKINNQYSIQDMTYEDFFSLLKDRLEKSLSIEGYSYSSCNLTKITIKVDKNEEIK